MTPASRANLFKFLFMMTLTFFTWVTWLIPVLFGSGILPPSAQQNTQRTISFTLLGVVWGILLTFFIFRHNFYTYLTIERNISVAFRVAQSLISAPYYRLRTALVKSYLNIRYGWERQSEIYDLAVQNSQIRLVDICPGERHDPLKCELVRVALGDTAHEYEALSYTWGPAYALCSIKVNGLPLHVTKSLETALRQLRLPNASRRVWVDALCINQRNTLERSYQVSLMKKIYRYATEVLIWLGPQTPMMNSGMDFLALANTVDVPKDWFIHSLADNIYIYKNQWNAVVALFAEEYWRRVWIVQEIASASKLRILCGSRSIGWEVAVAAQSALNEMVLRDLPHHRAVMSDIAGVWHWVRTLNILRLGGFEGERIKVEHLSMLNQSRRALVSGDQNSLVRLLQAHWAAHATDPRDKIYALVGLATDCQTPKFQIDYSWSKRRVYLEAIKFLVECNGNLDILVCSISIMGSPWFLRAYGFRTWTPFVYWLPTKNSTKITGGDRYIYLGKAGPFTASGRERARARIVNQSPLLFERILSIPRVVLEAKGCSVDTIVLSGPKLYIEESIYVSDQGLKETYWPDHPEWVPRENRCSILGIRSSYSSFKNQDGILVNDENRDRLTEAFWRTLIYNRTHDGDEPPSDWGLMFAVIIDGPASVPGDFLPLTSGSSDVSNARAWAFVQPFMKALHCLRDVGHEMHQTKAGRVCMTREGATEDDTICVILGCNTPLVVRRSKNAPASNPFLNCAIQGPVYIHDYMYGRAIDELESGFLQLQTFQFV